MAVPAIWRADVKRERMMGLAHRMLHLLDTEATDLCPSSYEKPLTAYTSPEIFARERAIIFGRTPMFIGMSAEIPKTGDFFTRDFVDTPMLALRHKDGSVRLYLNACRHRGAKVALEPCGSATRFVCPFHAWGYDQDGRLANITEPEGFDDMDWDKKGLIALPVAEKYGMIFGCATPGITVDPDEILGGLGPEMAEWGFENFQMYLQPHDHEGQGNWKYSWDTFCENYHFATLHKKTLGEFLIGRRQAFDTFGRNVRMISATRSIHQMRELPEEQWKPEEHLSVQYRLYPSINFSIYPDFMAIFWVMPGKDQSHSRAIHITFLAKEPANQEKRDQIAFAIQRGCVDVVQNEDFWVTGLAETGMRAPGAPATFMIGKNEPALQHFNRLFAEAVGDEIELGLNPRPAKTKSRADEPQPIGAK
jgi:phenylpropionate dioxygenase-like ring-hydroxylating dioxygenase large terminal subunit